MWHNEVEVREKLPPMKIIEVSNEVTTTNLSEIVTRFQQRPYSLQRDIPIGNLLLGCCYLIRVFAVRQLNTKNFRGITNNIEMTNA